MDATYVKRLVLCTSATYTGPTVDPRDAALHDSANLLNRFQDYLEHHTVDGNVNATIATAGVTILTRLINSARSHHTHTSDDFAAVDINKEILLLEQGAYLSSSGIAVGHNLASDLYTIDGISDHILAVAFDLCDNAAHAIEKRIKLREDGYIGRISFTTANVTLSESDIVNYPCANPGEYVELSISDNGTGMSDKQLALLCNPTIPQNGGNGMGLVTIEDKINLHDGLLVVETVLGHGTTFRALFPRGQIEATNLATNGYNPGDFRILVVDDEKLNRNLLKRILERDGYQVSEASNGTDALDLYHANNPEIHLVIMDYNLNSSPNGFQTLEQMADIPGRALKGLFSTGGNIKGISQQSLDRLGCFHFLNKPYDYDKVITAVESLLKPPS